MVAVSLALFVRTVLQRLTRLQAKQRVARSLCYSWASCKNSSCDGMTDALMGLQCRLMKYLRSKNLHATEWRKLLCKTRRLKTVVKSITFSVSRRRRKMYSGHARLCVLSAAVRPHHCTDPDVAWRSGRGCPLVVHYWADLQPVHGLPCYGNITRTLVTSLHPSRDMTT